MNSYFSRIAQQSGLRFSEPGGGTRAGKGTHTSHRTPPLGIVEMVLVPPNGADARVIGSNGREPKGKAQTAEQLIPEVRGRQQQARAIREEKAPTENKPAAELRILERTVFADTGMPEAHAQADPAKTEEPKAQTVEAEPFEKAGKKVYFTETAEVFELGHLGAVEIQNIVLHEVQAWAAASPTEADMRDINVAETPETIVKQKIVRAVPELGVITSRGESQVEKAESAENSELEEQSFNLSIGTISVVVEDAEKPVLQAELRRQGQGNQNRRQGSARQFSRLSRNYL